MQRACTSGVAARAPMVEMLAARAVIVKQEDPSIPWAGAFQKRLAK